MNGLIDIHCHILPMMDDGAKTPDDALALLRAQRSEQGVSKLVFTPHFYPERESASAFLERRSKAMNEMEKLLPESGTGIETHVGAEVYYTPILHQMPLDQLCFSGTRYLLLELHPLCEPLDVEGTITRLRDRDYVPILAHIERFPYIEADPSLLQRWVKAGALTQINAGAVMHSKQTLKRLEQYYKRNLVHLMASDTHSISRRPPNLSQGYSCLPREMAETLRSNAQSVFADQEICASEPQKRIRRFSFWK